MKLFILTLFLCFSVVSYSQNDYKKIERALAEANRLMEAKKFEPALKQAFLADSLFKEVEGTETMEYAFLKMMTGNIYDFSGDKKNAEIFYKESTDLFREYAPEDEYFVVTLNEYSLILIEQERYSEAEPLLMEAMGLVTGPKQKKSGEYAYTLVNLGSLYYNAGDLKKAESFFQEALGIDELKKGKNAEDYALALDFLASIYVETERYNLAIGLYNDALKGYRKSYGDKSSDYVYVLYELADIYVRLSQYTIAEPLFKKAIETERSERGDKSYEYAIYISGLAELYKETDEYDKSEALFKEALDICLKGGHECSLVYVGLSDLYMLKADFAEAEQMALKSMSEKDLAEKNTDAYLTGMNLLANLYTITGNYDKAEKIYLDLQEKGKTVYGEESTFYAIDLDNIGNLYLVTGKPEKARPYVLQSLGIKKKMKGEISDEVAYSYNNLSIIYLEEGNLAEAEKNQKLSLEIYRKIYGEQSTNFGNAVFSLGKIYAAGGRNDEAETLFLKSAEISRIKTGTDHPGYATTLMKLAEVYEKTGRPDSAEANYLFVNRNLQRQISRNFSYMSEKEKESFIEDINSDFSQFNSFVYRRYQKNPSLSGVAYNNQLALKGVVLQSSRALRQAVMNSGDQRLSDLYDKLTHTKSLLLEHQKLPLSQRWLDTDSLENSAMNQEKEIMKIIQGTPGLKDISGFDNSYRWEEVRDALGEHDAAIEFISFDSADPVDTTENILYCALLLRPGCEYPELISLFGEDDLQSFITGNKSPNDATTADRLYRFTPRDENLKGQKNLYEIIWKKIDNSLKNTERIFYSPTGLLNLISFDAIPCSDSSYLSDRYKLVAVSSTREVLKNDERSLKEFAGVKAVFYGGINYESDTSRMRTGTTKAAVFSGLSRSRISNPGASRGGGFVFLDGSLSEVEKINSILADHKIRSEVIKGDDATEESFKSLNNLNSPACIHIATHGFFFPEAGKAIGAAGARSTASGNTFRTSENPLLRSGLIFAGGNHAWKNEPLPRNVEDGILLASEVSEMYLPNTRLVVLSACETGLGEIKGTEGVFGLQRAFKMAGVGSLIISLWQVPDYQTSELMTKFYSGWVSGKPLVESFRQAQDFMKKKYAGSPSAWAAFVLLN